MYVGGGAVGRAVPETGSVPTGRTSGASSFLSGPDHGMAWHGTLEDKNLREDLCPKVKHGTRSLPMLETGPMGMALSCQVCHRLDGVDWAMIPS